MIRSIMQAIRQRSCTVHGMATAVLTLGLAMQAALAPCAEALKVGDAVEVHFLGKWWPGSVVSTNARGMVMAEFEFAGQAKRQAFPRTEVRLQYEAGALSKPRVWSDASGKSRIRAVLIAVDEDGVTLRKPDMTEVQVPIDKLSESDQEFVKRQPKTVGQSTAKSPDPPPVEKFGGGDAGWGTSLSFGDAQRAAISPDPLPGFLKMKQGGVGFPLEDFFDRIGAVLPVGGKDVWLLAVVESGKPGDPLPTRLLWISLERQKIEGRQSLPPGEAVLDYHAPSHRLLTYNTVKVADQLRGTPVLTLWEVKPTDKQVKGVVRWNAGSERPGSHEPWARLLDGDTVLHRWTDHDLVAWDAAGKQMKYRITQESFFAPQPTLSSGRKQWFLPEDKGVRILESATGRTISTLRAEDGASAVAVSEDGRSLAVLGGSSVTVWDLTDTAAGPQCCQAEAIGTPFRATLAWVGPERLMAEREHERLVLFSLKHKLSLWNYQFDTEARSNPRAGRLHEIVNEHLVYAASVTANGQHGLAVGAVRLPGPKVEETAASLNVDSLMIVKPGTAVRLDVRAGNDNPRVQAALERKVQANEWKLDPSASTVILAEMTRGKSQQITYRPMGAGRGQREQTVTVTPEVSTIRIEVGGKVAWQSGTSSGAPPVLSLREGQSIQSESGGWQRPNPEFFDTVKIPSRILDPANRNGLGSTEVTNRGLIPK